LRYQPTQQEVLGRTNCILSVDIIYHIENDATNNFSIAVCIHFPGNVFIQPLHSDNMGDTHTHTHTGIQIVGRELRSNAIQMGSGAMIYISSFMKIGSGIQKLIEEDAQTYRWQGDLIILLVC
jgi:hypothetical protein